MDINSISISQVTVSNSKPNGKWDLSVQWNIEASGSGTADYWLILYKNFVEDERIAFSPKTLSHTFDALELDHTARYAIVLTASATKETKCNKVDLLFSTYTDIRAAYDGETIELSWAQTSDIKQGKAMLSSPDHKDYPAFPFAINELRRKLRINMSQIELKSDVRMECKLKPMRSENSYGPQPDPVAVYVCQPSILSVTVLDTKVAVTYGIPDGMYEDKANVQVQIALCKRQQVVYQAAKQPIVETSEAKIFRAEADIGDPFIAAHLDEYEAVLLVGTENATNMQITGQNRVSLSVPVASGGLTGDGRVRVQWVHGAGSDRLSGYQVYRNGAAIAQRVYGHELTLDDAAVGDSISVAPCYGGVIGRASAAVTAFRRGYYPTESGFRLYDSDYGQAAITVPLTGKVFEGEGAEEIKRGAFSLTGSEGRYALTVDRSVGYRQEDFDTFLDELFEQGLTVAAYYNIKNILPRIAAENAEDTLYMYCSMKSNSLCSDILPGMRIKTETEVYQKQLGSQQDDRIGYIRNAEVSYDITLGAYGREAVIDWNSYVSCIAGGYTGEAAADDPYRYNYSGLMDLFLTNLRKPFYRILYPASILDSREPGTPFASGNVILLAADSYDALKQNTEAKRTDIATPYVVLRGRSVVTPEITVVVNGRPETVTLGTTLGQYLARYGRPSSSGLTVSRESGLGETAEFVLCLGSAREKLDQIALLPGDRIGIG